MTVAQMVAELRDEVLNRPADDSLFDDPGDYEGALSKAHRYFYRKAAVHAPELLYVTATVTGDAEGRRYTLSDDHFGEIEVWNETGPPNGLRYLPARPDSDVVGYYLEGRDIVLTRKRVHTPGLKVRWVPSTVADLATGGQQSLLPTYFDDALIFYAASLLAAKPGSMLNSGYFRGLAMAEWRGSPDDPSDYGLLGQLKRQMLDTGYQSATDHAARPWYKFV